jgi:hypothetical protein
MTGRKKNQSLSTSQDNDTRRLSTTVAVSPQLICFGTPSTTAWYPRRMLVARGRSRIGAVISVWSPT